jgi:AcrR family transcriptional regulator
MVPHMDGRTRRRLATHERVLKSARALLAERGFDGVGLGEIAATAGVSRQAVYAHHFATKRDLLLALLDHVERVEGFAELIPPAFEAPTGVEALRIGVAGNAEFEHRISDVTRVLDAARRSDPIAAEAWLDRTGKKRAGIGELLERIEREGALRAGWTAEKASDLVFALLSGGFIDLLVVERRWSVEACAEATWQVIEGTLLAAPDGGG